MKDDTVIKIIQRIIIPSASILTIVMTACAVHEPLPGLCYTDKTGTYLCDEHGSPAYGTYLQCPIEPEENICK